MLVELVLLKQRVHEGAPELDFRHETPRALSWVKARKVFQTDHDGLLFGPGIMDEKIRRGTREAVTGPRGPSYALTN